VLALVTCPLDAHLRSNDLGRWLLCAGPGPQTDVRLVPGTQKPTTGWLSRRTTMGRKQFVPAGSHRMTPDHRWHRFTTDAYFFAEYRTRIARTVLVVRCGPDKGVYLPR
jgi:hypothetical protein